MITRGILRFLVGLLLFVFILFPCFYFNPRKLIPKSIEVGVNSRKNELRSSAEIIDIRPDVLKVQPTVMLFENSTAYAPNTNRTLSHVIERSSLANLSHFITFIKHKVMSRKIIHQPPGRFLTTVFHYPPYPDMVLPFCDGLWMEFGVFSGQSLNYVARWKATYCGNNSGPVYGFDTFSGLPTEWRPGFPKGAFSTKIDKLRTEPNVELVKGLFIDSLPLELFKHKNSPVAYVHIDCDIYEGARDVLFLLASRFAKGTVLVFDELFNYPQHEKHEIKAFFEFLVANKDLEMEVLGSAYPIALDDADGAWFTQSTGFVVV